MHVVIAPGRLKDGVTEAEMLAASERFQTEFVVHQPGVLRRILVADDAGGGYADIVFFADELAISEVVKAEQTSEVCHAFMALWEDGSMSTYRVLSSHERT